MNTLLSDTERLTANLRFADTHSDADVHRLALDSAKYPDVDMAFVIDQIAGRRTAQAKLPQWAATPGIIFPPHISMEQCSSQAAACRKAALVVGDTLLDMTGGLGVDFYFMARECRRAVFVERQELLCRIAQNNFRALGITAQVVHADSTEYLRAMRESVDTIYIDPARRSASGQRVFGLADCTPDVTQMLDTMMSKSRRVIIKLSPMLDLTDALRRLNHVSQVHVVSVCGECKELLVVIDTDHVNALMVHCVNDDNDFTYSLAEVPPTAPVWNAEEASALYLYEPNASVMKAGCHDQVARRFEVSVVSRDSHLYVSHRPLSGFPGRGFVIDDIITMNKRELRHRLQGVSHANVSTRNFPLRAPELARRLRLKDGGETYIFGTTLSQGKHVLIICRKL